MSAEVTQTPFGKFLVHPQDIIGSTTKAGSLWDGGCLEPVAKEYARLGEEGTTIIDLGANIGTFSLWCAFHDAWRVIAVEPHPEIMLMLKANIDLNRAHGTVVPIEVAAWDERAWLRQGRTVPLEKDGNSGGNFVVPDPAGNVGGIPMDDLAWLFGTSVSLIKCDVEGSEIHALEGLKHTIRGHHPAIIAECSADNFPVLVTSFLGLGYGWHEWPSLPGNYLGRYEGGGR